MLRRLLPQALASSLSAGALLLLPLWPVPAAAMLSGPSFPSPERIAREESLAEEQVYALIQAERAAAGLPTLGWDDRLWEAARAHSQDMRDRRFLGHVSPLFGDTATRVHRAGIATSVLLENVARAYSAHEAHFALMGSPGHKANILNPLATRVGIGVRIDVLEDGARELSVTEIFLRPPETFDPARTLSQVLGKVQEQRRRQGWLPLQDDRRLSDYARRTAEAISQGRLRGPHIGQLLRDDLPRLGRYRSLRVVHLRTVEARLIGDLAALDTPVLTHIGIGGAQETSKDPLQEGFIDLVLVLSQDAFLDAMGGEPGSGEGYWY